MSELRKIVLAGYEPTDGLSAPMADDFDQQVDGDWFYPKFGCDSLQHVLDSISVPSEADKKLLRAIAEYFDDHYDGAPDSSQVVLAMGKFIGPLDELIDRLK